MSVPMCAYVKYSSHKFLYTQDLVMIALNTSPLGSHRIRGLSLLYIASIHCLNLQLLSNCALAKCNHVFARNASKKNCS